MQRWGYSKGGIVLNALTIWARGKTGPQRQVGGKLTFANRLFFCLVCACHGVLSLFFYRWPVFFTMSASLGTSSSHILHLPILPLERLSLSLISSLKNLEGSSTWAKCLFLDKALFWSLLKLRDRGQGEERREKKDVH